MFVIGFLILFLVKISLVFGGSPDEEETNFVPSFDVIDRMKQAINNVFEDNVLHTQALRVGKLPTQSL